MRTILWALVVFLLYAFSALPLLGQAENVPATHPVYDFLKRMEVKGIIDHYHDAILPLSRREVGEFLDRIKAKADRLTDAEQGFLAYYLSQFQFDRTGSTEGFHSLIDSPDSSFGQSVGQIFTNREKYLYMYTDTSVTFFVNGLLTVDGRGITGDALGSQNTEFVQFGGRIRGTIYNRLGYYLQATNAQFKGSRDLLFRDRVISQAYTLGVTDTKSFDFAEGYVRYDGGIVSAEIGRERLLWGNGYDQKMIVSDNVRVFDCIRMDAQYKSLKYTFMHGWLLGTRSYLTFTLPSDTSAKFTEPLNADKYIAAHRLEFSFPHLFDIGGQEMVIYSNRAPDLAYLNPVTLIESAQRSRDERDNVLWAFDIQTHFVSGLELTGTLLLDDIHFSEFFKPYWYNRYGYQAGMMLTDPLMIHNTSVMVEWTRIEPYVFSHGRSRDDNYGSLGAVLGPRIGPNADSWFFRVDYLPKWNLSFSVRVLLQRNGENVVDSTGHLIKNVGGDFLQPHRDSDPLEKIFLDGIRVNSRRVDVLASYEVVRQIWFDAWYLYESVETPSAGTSDINHTFGVRVRTEF